MEAYIQCEYLISSRQKIDIAFDGGSSWLGVVVHILFFIRLNIQKYIQISLCYQSCLLSFSCLSGIILDCNAL